MTAPRFDFTINLGHLISVGSVLVVMIVGYASFSYRLEAVERAVNTSTASFTKVIEQGRDLQNLIDRVLRLEQRVDRRYPE